MNIKTQIEMGRAIAKFEDKLKQIEKENERLKELNKKHRGTIMQLKSQIKWLRK